MGNEASSFFNEPQIAFIAPIACAVLLLIIYTVFLYKRRKKLLKELYILQPSMMASATSTDPKKNLKYRYSKYTLDSGTSGSPFDTLIRNSFNSTIALSSQKFDPTMFGSSKRPSLNQRKTYHESITREEMDRFHQIKSRATVNRSQLSRLKELLDLPDQASQVGSGPLPEHQSLAWRVDARSTVAKICAKLESQMLTAVDINTLAKKETRGKALDGFSEQSPGIALEVYLFRLVTGMNHWFSSKDEDDAAGIRSLLLSIVYLDRISKAVPYFTLTEFNVHKLFAVMTLIAAKFVEDEVVSNFYWAEVTGIEKVELNKLEDDFCISAKFDFYVSPNELKALYAEYNLEMPNLHSATSALSTMGRDQWTLEV